MGHLERHHHTDLSSLVRFRAMRVACGVAPYGGSPPGWMLMERPSLGDSQREA